MKFIWKGRWNFGDLIIESDNFEDLSTFLGNIPIDKDSSNIKQKEIQGEPKIKGNLNLPDALRELIKLGYFDKPHSAKEVWDVLNANSLPFELKRIHTNLKRLYKSGELRRTETPEGFAYIKAPQ